MFQDPRAQLLAKLDLTISDENKAISEYQALATQSQAWVNTLPQQQRYLYQAMVNDIRSIQGDEVRHHSSLQRIRGQVAAFVVYPGR